MPIYEYECEECGRQFELRRSFGDDSSVECPQCHCTARRIFTSVPVIFKGSGFYVTDHRKPEPPGEQTTASTASKPDTGTKTAEKPVD